MDSFCLNSCYVCYRLVIKKVFRTHNFAVGLIDMGNSESQDP